MSKRLTDRDRLLFKLNRLTDNEIKEVLQYIAGLETMRRRSVATPESLPEVSGDDLVVLLSSAYENQRARQVFEWESARRRAEARTLNQRYTSR